MNPASSQFLTQLAHDIRSPLNVIGSTFTELADEPGLTAGAAQILARSQAALGELVMLSNRIFLAARLDQPFEMAVTTVDLVKLTQDTLSESSAAARPELQVLSVFPSTAVPVRADASLLAAAVRELLSNANRCAGSKVSIEVSLGDFASVRIEDDGEGIREDERPLLFEPFADRRNATGLGIGLWLAKSVAELHKGTLTVDHLSRGTGQQLRLPISR